MSFPWNDEHVAALRRMHGEASASQIAAAIGAPSRNSVIGKAHRLGLAQGVRTPANKRTKAVPSGLARPVATTHPQRKQKYRPAPRCLPPVAPSNQRVVRTTRLADLAPPDPRTAPVRPRSRPRSLNPVPFLDRTNTQCATPLWNDERFLPVTELFVCGAPTVARAGGEMTSCCADCYPLLHQRLVPADKRRAVTFSETRFGTPTSGRPNMVAAE